MKSQLHGIISYPITPFDRNDRIDHERLAQLVGKMIEAGVHAIAPLGSAGVLPYLSDSEREAVATTVLGTVAQRVPTLVGVSSITTERTLHHARLAEKLGASALMVMPLSYWKLTEAEILAHYRKVAGATSLPVVVYNNPATSGVDLPPEMLARLLQIPNVSMIKESTGDVNRMHLLVERCGPEVTIFNGSNPLALSAMLAGARGWCTAAPHVIPELTIELYEAVTRGDLGEARKLFHKQLPFLRFIVAHGLPRAISAALDLMGMPVGPLRAPLQSLTSKEHAVLRHILVDLGKLPG